MGKGIFFHEDLYRQIEFVPEESFSSVDSFIHNLQSKRKSSYGFNIIEERPKADLLDRHISIEGIRKVLGPISLLYSEEVKTGYGDSTYIAKDTIVWGFEQYGLFVKQKKGNAEAIWLSDSSLFVQDRIGARLSKALFDLSEFYSLILIDWDVELIFRFHSQLDAQQYLSEHLSFD